MAVNVAEYMTKLQDESLSALKETQDASLKAIGSFRELAKEIAEKPGTVPAFENIPSPTQFVELSFGFAGQLLELRKSFALRFAQMLVETQKQTEASFKDVNVATIPPKPPTK